MLSERLVRYKFHAGVRGWNRDDFELNTERFLEEQFLEKMQHWRVLGKSRGVAVCFEHTTRLIEPVKCVIPNYDGSTRLRKGLACQASSFPFPSFSIKALFIQLANRWRISGKRNPGFVNWILFFIQILPF